MYVAEMRRWGDNETHHYIVAVTPCLLEAVCEAYQEVVYRGGKYNGVVLKFENSTDHGKEIWEKEGTCKKSEL